MNILVGVVVGLVMLIFFIVFILNLRKRATLRHVQDVITVKEQWLEFINKLDEYPLIMEDKDLRKFLRNERLELWLELRAHKSKKESLSNRRIIH